MSLQKLVVVIVCLAMPGTAMGEGAVDASLARVEIRALDYYKGIDLNQTGPALKQALHTLINVHTNMSYNNVWLAFDATDDVSSCPDDKLVDVYSSKCWTEHTEQCGDFKQEGDCYNREHSWPKSWWGGMSAGKGAQTDLFHIYPTDGFVNAQRSNLPLGTVDSLHNVTSTSSNGAKIGPCTSANAPLGSCFEPPDTYKGDFARSYFYVSTSYHGLFDCCDDVGVDGAEIKPWMETVLRGWAKLDPVSDKEKQRNEQIFNLQKNRNPFIDLPQLVDQITDF